MILTRLQTLLFGIPLITLFGSLMGFPFQEKDWSIFLPEDESKHLVTHLCLSCHDLGLVVTRRGDYAFWEKTIIYMNTEGADIRHEESALLSTYLSSHFGRDQKPVIFPIDINKATREVIELIQPIARQAESILKARAGSGGFLKLEELLKVEGITEESFQKVRPFLSLSSPSRPR